ncbi:MAG: hypothetical protein MUC48_00735 [Leptolyngbya sp. Prado105]|nr:hypothetical protein [Leptolyngbya sp. Prado105]
MPQILVQAQSCVNSNQTPLTKVRLEAIATNLNIPPTQVELRFEAFALNTIIPSMRIARNPVKFFSQDRLTRARISNVQPDGVMPLIVVTPGGIATFANSVFYESKAVHPTRLPPSYQNYQVLGFLDALRNSPAGNGSGVPAIVFMTTSDVTSISRKTRFEASIKRVAILHTIACEIPSTPAVLDNLQLGAANIANPEVYFFSLAAPLPVGPGRLGRL